MAKRVDNFYAGPAALPLEVLEEVQRDLIDYKGQGLSIMEMSHRCQTFDEIINQTKSDLKKIVGLGDDYSVLFLGGGASTQFAMIPYNFLKEGMTANYINTGAWATKAIKEAKKIGQTNVIASSEDRDFNYIPGQFTLDQNAAYLHFTSNNTIRGTQWQQMPDSGQVPLVCDMSSDFLSRNLDYSKFSLIYAGAQKNVGPSGVTVVIIKNDLLEQMKKDDLMTMWSYKTHVDKDSMFNTPPSFLVYIVGLVMKWILNQGGLTKIEELNQKKASLLYDCMDQSNGFYTGTADRQSRSNMNVTFRLKNEDLEKKLISLTAEKELIGLKGHRSVGGLRASIYNATSFESVERLVQFMQDFKNKN